MSDLSEKQLELLKELEQCWKSDPSLRFGQLICLICRQGKLQFDMSDNDLLEKVKEFYAPVP